MNSSWKLFTTSSGGAATGPGSNLIDLGDVPRAVFPSAKLIRAAKTKIQMELPERSPKPIKVFVSYPRTDNEWREKIAKTLIMLKRENEIELWYDGEMTAGVAFEPEIARRLGDANLILLLISTDFFVSDYCWKKEMEPALARHDAGTARVVPIIVRPCEWRRAPFAHLIVLPANGEPLSTWKHEDSGLLDVALGLRRTVLDLRGK